MSLARLRHYLADVARLCREAQPNDREAFRREIAVLERTLRPWTPEELAAVFAGHAPPLQPGERIEVPLRTWMPGKDACPHCGGKSTFMNDRCGHCLNAEGVMAREASDGHLLVDHSKADLEADPPPADPATDPLWDGMPEIDSKAVVKASPVIRGHTGADLDPRLIRKGGYTSLDDLIRSFASRAPTLIRQPRSNRAPKEPQHNE